MESEVLRIAEPFLLEHQGKQTKRPAQHLGQCDVADDSNLYPECGNIPDSGYTAVSSNSSISVGSGYTKCATLGASAVSIDSNPSTCSPSCPLTSQFGIEE